MNTYNLGLTGSWILLILLFGIAITLTFYAYKITNPPISNRKRLILISLRSLAMIMLIFALFEPILQIISGQTENPSISILLDNSQSMIIKESKFDRKETYQRLYDQSNIEKFDDKSIALFDNNYFKKDKFTFDSLNFYGVTTDISHAIRTVSNSIDESNIRSLVLFSDGCFNQGNNPIYDAENLGVPIYVVGIGDTNRPKDIIVKSLITNEIAYLNSELPISTNISVNGYENRELSIEFLDNGNFIEKKAIYLSKDQNEYNLDFIYKPTQEGIHKLTIKVDNFENEVSILNNSVSDFVKVLKNKKKIGIFAGASSSDLSFIKQVLAGQKDIEVNEFIQKSGSDFYTTPTANLLNELEMIIFIGFPISSTPVNLINQISNEISKGKPILFLASQLVDYSKLKPIEPYLPFNVATSKSNEFLVNLDISKDNVSNPLFKITGSEDDAKLWNNLPPVFRTETFVRLKPESDLLATLKINNTTLNEPLIATRDFQGNKSIGILGYGLYRWKLLGYAQDIAKGKKDVVDLYTSFINNSLKWLSVKDINKRFILKSNKKFYSQGEDVELIAQVYDLSYNPLNDADIKVQVISKREQREVTLVSIGNGRYHTKIEGLSADDFTYSGTAYQNKNKVGIDYGKFNVGEYNPELMNYTMNIALLKSLSERTGGKFYDINNISNLIADIKSNPVFKERGTTLKKEIALWNEPWILILAVLFLAIEWFIHKRSGMI